MWVYMRLILIALLICFSTSDLTADAANINAVSCSLSDVMTAVENANEGDSVYIPAGTCDWNGSVTINKALTIQGVGNNATNIRRAPGYTGYFFVIALPSDAPVRISSIYFDSIAYVYSDRIAIYVAGKTDGSFAYTKIRIDNNKFSKFRRAVWIRGWVHGVLDHNIFVNCGPSVMFVGDNNYSWNRPILAGTANAMFIENNTFIVNDDVECEPGTQIYHQEGARSVTRYNTFDSSEYTKTNCGSGSSKCTFQALESHGNGCLYAKGTFRGQPIIEIYNNVVYSNFMYRFFYIKCIF